MAQVRLSALGKDFGSFRALDGVTLTVEDGELFALLGPSGCGKTTALRCVAGLEQPSGGDIFIGAQSVLKRPPNERPCGMVFQGYALFPHLSVFDNVAYGLRAHEYAQSGPVGKGLVLGSFVSQRLFPPSATMRHRVHDALQLVDLAGEAERMPGQLSGGMQQRVALARAIVTEPEVLLLDEPLSNLDRKLRVSMRSMIRKLQQQLHITAIYVTHDQEEALSLADRIAIMDHGRLVQLGTPAEIYDAPATPFVADFIGAENLLPGTVAGLVGDELVVRTAALEIRAAGRITGNAGATGARVRVVVRPQAIRIAPSREALDVENVFDGTVRFGAYLGATARYEVEVADTLFIVDVPDPRPGALLRAGDRVGLGFAANSVILVSEA
ncbi:MAG: ABC transporter ATP-binding protein [Betaproteobacteria bacterium]|nr:ABC transporter ATP-binding protein [Betaproteobacteria bacterium]